MSRRSIRATAAAVALVATTGALGPAGAQAPAACPAPEGAPTFTEEYIDTTRAGGEPIVVTHPDGTLLWGSHAGTTHLFGPAAPTGPISPFVQEYQGQTYYYFSDDDGATWQFVPRSPAETADPTTGLPASGFSDPEFAIDAAGNVFVSEINLANIAVSRSSDGGRSYELQNVLALSFSDRQWMEADTEDVLYMTANTFGGGSPGDVPPLVTGSTANRIYKSVDGGVTWSPGQTTVGGRQASSDIVVDKADGTVYMLDTRADDLTLVRMPNARDEMPPDLTIESLPIATEYSSISSIGPTLAIDEEGGLYVVWDESGEDGREPGIWFTASQDRGETWTEPVRVSDGEELAFWPWVAVGDPGRASVVWLENEEVVPSGQPEDATAGWNVMAAQTVTAFGCEDGDVAGFTVTTASSEPVHTGSMCNSGTICQALAVDRRLGDYFSNTVDDQGRTVIAVSDTRSGGPVSLPLVIRQTGGPTLLAEDVPPTVPPTAPPTPTEPPEVPEPPLGCAGAAPADPGAPQDRVKRIDTSDAVALAVATSQACVPSAAAAVLARDDVFADALAATGLAASLGGPVLLTPSGGLDDRVAAELDRLGVGEVVLAGGEAALSPQVEADLDALGIDHRRVAGDERFSTAAAAARALAERTGSLGEVVVALGARPDEADAWPDALSAGVLSGQAAAPVVLVTPDGVPEPTRAVVDELLGGRGDVRIVGGTAAVSQDVALAFADAGYDVSRLAGSDRYGTSTAVVEAAIAEGAGVSTVLVAGGESFQAPLVAGAASLLADGVMVIVQPDDLDAGSTTRQFLESRAEEIEQVLVVGGEDLVSAAVEAQLEEALSGG
jgi:putative cell wall-binding protein